MEIKKIGQINQIIKSEKYLQNKEIILEILNSKELRVYFLENIIFKINNLEETDFILNEIIKNEEIPYLYKILQNNINKKNNEFIIRFIRKYYQYQKLEKFKKNISISEMLLQMVKEILDKYPENTDNIISLFKSLLEARKKNYKNQDLKDEYEQEKQLASEILKKIFTFYATQKRNDRVKEIINLIENYFNLIADDGEYTQYTPKKIFEILEYYIAEDKNKFEERFIEIITILCSQYDSHYRSQYNRKEKFNGWELMGGVSVFWSHNYKVFDRHFIRFILQPALNKYYEFNPEKAWAFILNECIISENKVSKINPDFLNRTAIPILLERYKNKSEEISDEAFIILKEFILSRKGIPNKAVLIFQQIRKEFPDNKRLHLVEEYIKYYKLPYSCFIEDIILQLAKNENQKAKDIIEEWTSTPDFLRKTEMLGGDVASRIENYLDYSFPVGLKLFKNCINQDDFINNDKNYEIYQIGKILNKIVYQDFQSGIEIIKNIITNKKLSDNQQILIFYCLLPKSEDINKPENLEIFEKLYCEFLDPFLNNLSNDIKKIEERITQSQAREAIVDFAEALAKNKKIKEAMRIVGIFINDSDPCTPQKIDSKDPEGKYDKHQQIINGEGTNTITTVRGKCAWALNNCITLAGREYLEKIIDLTEKLTNDKNYYIQEQSCVTLSRLAGVRFSITPENKEELFFNQDKEKALKMAKKIEKIAFGLLGKFLSLDQKPRNVLINQLLRVFNYLKYINQKSVEKLLNSVLKCNDKVISEAVPLFIYFAEFRHRAYHDWKWSLPGLFDDLEDFDNKKFKDTLIETIKRGNPKINVNFAWHFNDIVKNTIGDNKELKSIIEYDEAFKMANNYLNIIAESKGNIDKHFEECYVLWQKCLCEERDFIEKNLNSIDTRRMHWWPFDKNGEILESIKDKAGSEEFLKSFKLLLDYPIKYYFPDIGKAIKILEELPKKYNKEVNELFQKLITKEPKYFDRYEKWKTKNNIL
jgi:hypothetical protein